MVILGLACSYERLAKEPLELVWSAKCMLISWKWVPTRSPVNDRPEELIVFRVKVTVRGRLLSRVSDLGETMISMLTSRFVAPLSVGRAVMALMLLVIVLGGGMRVLL